MSEGKLYLVSWIVRMLQTMIFSNYIMIFTPVIVSHHKFMVIPFVYADKALYAWDFSTNALWSTDSSVDLVKNFNFF